MKNLNIIVLSVCFAAIISSCSKKHNVTPVPVIPAFPSYISQVIIDSLQKHGMDVNLGLTPPTINGFYVFDPFENTYSSLAGGPDGVNYLAEIVQFLGENNTTLGIKIAYNQGNGTEVGRSDTAVVIRGANNLFTVFAHVADTTRGVISEDIQLYSGQFTTTGITNLQYAFYLKSKGPDPQGYIVPVGTIRVFKDGDGTSEPATSLSQSTALPPNKAVTSAGAHALKKLLMAQ